MSRRQPRIIGQLVLGKAECERFAIRDIADCLSRARDIARLDALLFWPSSDAAVDAMVRGFCRENGIEIHLWLPVLADAGFEPDPGDLVENAWGGRGSDPLGAWEGLGRGEESFLFACPLAMRQRTGVRERMDAELPRYDGAFLDRIRYPSPANGLRSLFTCFCPRCMEREPRLREWRKNCVDFCDRIASSGDPDMDRWESLESLAAESGLGDFMKHRAATLAESVESLSAAARGMGKRVALDMFTPRLAAAVGQDYSLLGSFADWIKPMSYCFARGPAGIPLELACLARGILAVGNFSAPTVMAALRRTYRIPDLPDDPDALERDGLPPSLAGSEYRSAARLAGIPAYPGFECVRHPDFDFDMRTDDVAAYVRTLADAPAVVMAWNLLYTPDDFLRIIAEAEP